MQTRTHPVCIVNPAAGNGRWRRIAGPVAARWRASGLRPEIVLTEGPGAAEKIAAQAARSGAESVIGVGGDGTLQEVVNGLLTVSRPPALGIIPAGTGNDFARNLGLPLHPLEAAGLIGDALQSASGAAERVDVARCNGRYFINAGGAGFDAEVAHAVNRSRLPQRGLLPYLLQTVARLPAYTGREFTIQLDDRVLQRRALLVVAANGPRYGGGICVCPDADMADGLLDVCVIGEVHRLERFPLMARALRGGHRGHPLVEFHRAASVRITAEEPVRVHTDGEDAGMLPAVFEAAQARLAVLGAEETLDGRQSSWSSRSNGRTGTMR